MDNEKAQANCNDIKNKLIAFLSVLEKIDDPEMAEKAKKVESLIDQAIAFSSTEQREQIVKQLIKLNAAEHGSIWGYISILARIIEFAVIASVGVKYLFLC